MFFLFAATGFTGYLGWQWRRVRTIPDEVAELKAQLPKAPAGGASARAPNAQQGPRLLHTARARAPGVASQRGLRSACACNAVRIPLPRFIGSHHAQPVLTRLPRASRVPRAASASPPAAQQTPLRRRPPRRSWRCRRRLIR
jgi:hypothetical protein